jgi:hypothetical protein
MISLSSGSCGLSNEVTCCCGDKIRFGETPLAGMRLEESLL